MQNQQNQQRQQPVSQPAQSQQTAPKPPRKPRSKDDIKNDMDKRLAKIAALKKLVAEDKKRIKKAAEAETVKNLSERLLKLSGELHRYRQYIDKVAKVRANQILQNDNDRIAWLVKNFQVAEHDR